MTWSSCAPLQSHIGTDMKASIWTQTSSIIPKKPHPGLNNLPLKGTSNSNQDESKGDTEQEIPRLRVVDIIRALHVLPGDSRGQPELVPPQPRAQRACHPGRERDRNQPRTPSHPANLPAQAREAEAGSHPC